MYKTSAPRKTPRKLRPTATPQPRLGLTVRYVAVLTGGDILILFDRPATLQAGRTPANWFISGSSLLAGSGQQISRDAIRFSVVSPVSYGTPVAILAGDTAIVADDLGLQIKQNISMNG